MDHLAAPTMRSAPKLARDHEPVVRQLHVVARRSPKQAPVVFVHLDDCLAELVHLVEAIEPLETPSSLLEIVTHQPWIVVRIQGQLAEELVGVVVVAVLLELSCLGTQGRLIFARSGGRQPLASPGKPCHPSHHDQPNPVHDLRLLIHGYVDSLAFLRGACQTRHRHHKPLPSHPRHSSPGLLRPQPGLHWPNLAASYGHIAPGTPVRRAAVAQRCRRRPGKQSSRDFGNESAGGRRIYHVTAVW